MRRLPFTLQKNQYTALGMADSALVADDEDPIDELCDTILGDLGTELWITIGGTSMFLAAWRDPEHWGEDWARHFEVPYDDAFDAEERVAQIISDAIEEGGY